MDSSEHYLRDFQDGSILSSLLSTPFIHGDQANNEMHYASVAYETSGLFPLSVRVIEDRLEQLAQRGLVACSSCSYTLTPTGEEFARAIRDSRAESRADSAGGMH